MQKMEFFWDECCVFYCELVSDVWKALLSFETAIATDLTTRHILGEFNFR